MGPFGCSGTKKSTACLRNVYRSNQITGRLRFQHNTLSARRANFLRKSLRLMHRKHKDPALEPHIRNPCRDLQAAGLRQRNIEDDDIRLQRSDRFNGLLSFAGLATDFPFGARPGD